MMMADVNNENMNSSNLNENNIQETEIPKQELQRMQAQMGAYQKQQSLVYMGEENEERRITEKELNRKATLYFKSNRGCNYHINAVSTKVLIEDCHNSIFHFNAKINTEMVEFWKCTNCQVYVNNETKVKTMQVDLCNNSSFEYSKKSNFGSIVWAASNNLQLQAENLKMEVGIEIARNDPRIEEINEEIEQFIIRIIKGRLLQERVVRLSNGFPTTDREADKFDKQKERNDKLYEEHVRRLLFSKKVAATEKLENLSRNQTKVGRNDKCVCGSQKKFKKCCEVVEKQLFQQKLAENKASLAEEENSQSQKSQEIVSLATSISENLKKNTNIEEQQNDSNNNNNQN